MHAFVDFNTLSFKIFPLTDARFLNLEGFKDILAQDKTMAARFSRTWVCCREGDIRKRSSMNAFTGGDKSDWKIEMSIPADINSKITFIPAKNNIIETVQPVKIPLKCWYQLDGAMGEKDLLQRSP